jgi:group II intron reverse transcriptase/maturase
VKNILEPIFEADFYPCSYGFRPGKSVHGALEHLKSLLLPRRKGRERKTKVSPYQWAIEGDIKGCFDHIDHHGLMNRVRRRVLDTKVTRLIVASLKAGVLSEEQFTRTREGTPQGGILSPLLANIALSVIDERYERYVWPKSSPTPLTDGNKIEERAIKARRYDRPNRPVFVPIRYADDFIVLVSAPDGPEQMRQAEEAAQGERAALASMLKEQLKLELSESKTLVTQVTQPMRFLGHHVRVRDHHLRGPQCAVLVPKQKTQALREQLKRHFAKATTRSTLADRLWTINPKLRGWASFYRYAFGAKRLFTRLDHYVWWTIFRWLRKKHPTASVRHLLTRYGWRKPAQRTVQWRDGQTLVVRLGQLRTGAYRMMWQRLPDFASTSTESPVHNERCTPGSERGTRKPADESR